MSNSPSLNQKRSADIASILSPIISVALAYAGATTPNIIISFFVLAVLALLGIILVNDGHKLAAILYGLAFVVIASHLVYEHFPGIKPPQQASTDYENAFREGMKAYTQGMETSDREKFMDAVRKFKEALRINPDFTEASIYLGRSHFKLGNFEPAQDAFQKAYKVAPAEVKDDLISLYVEWAKDLCHKGQRHRLVTIAAILQGLDGAKYSELMSTIGNC